MANALVARDARLPRALGIGAGDGDRTHDILLGKQTLYH